VVFVALTEIAADDDDSPLEKRSRQTLQITWKVFSSQQRFVHTSAL
jgi:hypothetical protein